jgi:diphosphomevalonate decarboxylase
MRRVAVKKATAVAYSNIAFVKYWGHADIGVHVPANPSISMNLDSLSTMTTVAFADHLVEDTLTIDGAASGSAAVRRVSAHLDRIRARAGCREHAHIASCNSFPTGAGLASSASAFAALTMAATAALGMVLSEEELSSLARLGSGSACRSIPTGFVEWMPGADAETLAARSVAPPEHWALCDCIAIVSTRHKEVGSADGHARAPSSPLHRARVENAAVLVTTCRQAIMRRDLGTLGGAMEADAVMMHAVAMTSCPPIYYWTPDTLRIMRSVIAWRVEGVPVYYTIDAGANVHCLCESTWQDRVLQQLRTVPGVQHVLSAGPGRGAHLVSEHLL